MHDGVEIIQKMAFSKCHSLRGIKLAGVRVIEKFAFYFCTALEDAEFGKKLETIGEWAFQSCTSLRIVKIPKVRSIETSAFAGCEQLTEVELSEDLETIEEFAFGTCPVLRRIAMPLKDNLLEVDVFTGCDALSQVDLVGGIHKTVSSLLLDSWRNEMKDEIDRINRDLPNTPHNKKSRAIRQWLGRVLERLEHFKSGGGESEVQRLIDQLKKSNNKAAALEERLKESEEENIRLKKRMKYSKECEVIDLNEHEEAPGEVSTEEDSPKQPPASSLAVLKQTLEVKQEAIERAETAEADTQALEEKLAVMEEQLRQIERRHGPTDSRQVKEKLMECLQNHKVKVGRSTIDPNGVGAIAIVDIPEGTRLFHFNGAPTDETIELAEDDIEDLPLHVQGVIKMFTMPDPDNDGVRHVPKNGFSFALGVSWYINSVDDTGLNPNVGVGPDLDESGFDELVATEHIKAGEELLLGYKLSDTLLGQQLPQNK